MQKQFGLNSTQVQKSLQEFGSNKLTPHKQESFWDKYKGNFSDPIIRILLVALAINVIFTLAGHGEWFETLGILLAIILATFVSTYSEYSNENTFQQLQEEASRTYCKVWRDEKVQEILIDELVCGDAIIIQSGDKIPVDGIMLEGFIKVDQSVLNGESKEAAKHTAPAGFDFDACPVDFLDTYKLFRGTVVVEGEAVMQAIKIGDKTVYGQLTLELASEERDSPLKIKLTQLAHKISKFGYAGGVLIAIAVMIENAIHSGNFWGYFSNYPVLINDLLQAIILAVVIIVMAVPEGLPLMIAIVSSLNMSKMLKDNVLVRKIVGIETAGSLNLLFSDKTGTITKGQLEVVRFLSGDKVEYNNIESIPTAQRQLLVTSICHNSSAKISEDKVIGGNSTERALGQFILWQCSTMIRTERQFMIPFNSADKYSIAVVAGDLTGALIKGAPEKLLSHTDFYYDQNGQKQVLTTDYQQALEEQMLAYANQAMRMLALCVYEGDYDVESGGLPANNLILLGILAIRDDVRPEAVEAIKAVQEAGVQVVMITGDRRETAVAIAKESNLITSDSDVTLTSEEMQQLSDAQLKELLPKLRVVARALPSDKSRFVKIAQELNMVVGMTGDGVNDSPALKKADVGFAMGSGTEVAKEAGDIVILDDNFNSIEKAILYGRTIYNSIRKFITFQLTINVAAVSISFIGPFIGIDKPLTITQILWINLVMDTLAAMAFGGEPALMKYMQEKPKKRDENIVSPQMLSSIFTNGLYLTALGLFFLSSAAITGLFRTSPNNIYMFTGFFNLFTFLAIINAFNVRSEGLNIFQNLDKNPGFTKIMALILGIQIAMTFLGGKILRTTPLQLDEWFVVIGLSLTILVVEFMRKLLTR